MKKEVEVTIERHQNRVVVSNQFGKKWEFPFESPHNNDDSCIGAIADIAAAMLTGTIVSHLKNSSSRKIKYTLTVDPR